MANKPLKSIKFPGLPDVYTIDSGLSDAVKEALLACFRNVAWTTEEGQNLYNALYNAFYPDTRIISISAVFTQGTAKIYTTDSLDVLKQYLTVTVTYYGGTESVVTDYVLSGVLEEGTSTINVIYGGKTATFNVIVSPVISKRYITSEDVESHVGISDISVSNGTISETSPTTFSGVIFDQSIGKMWFHLHTHRDDKRRPRYVFRKEQDGSFYGIDETTTSPKLYHFTLDQSGNKYSATQVSDVSSITTITKSGDYFSSLEKEMSLSNGVLSVVDEDSSISFTNANCFGYWQAAYNTNINTGMFDDCEVEYNGSV